MYTPASWDYLDMARRLRLAGVFANPAEAHGMAYGLTIVFNAASSQKWQAELYADCNGDEAQVLECQRMLAPLYQDAQRQHATETVPEPCLPPEDQDIQIKAVGLRDWSRGFLYGLGLSGYQESISLSPEAHEALVDISELARLDVPQQSNSMEDELALFELQECLRVSLTIIRGEIRASSARKG